ncbi:MAG: hypothetical protein SV201_06885 [Pseudomonadota bacterium]|nr:hypothetical protein [Pseudomonadota bacterium]
MKLIFDLGRKLVSRFIVILLVLIALIVMAANEQNRAEIDQKQIRLQTAIDNKNQQITAKIAGLQKSERRQRSLKSQISGKTRQLETISNRLERSRRARLKDKLPPWKVTEYILDSVRLNVERASLAVEYSQLMFSIVDTNKQIAKLTIEKTGLNNKLIVAQTSNLVDYVLAHESPVGLLTRGNWLLLLGLFYALFFGPVTAKAGNYYLFAPLARKARPISINDQKGSETDTVRYDTPQKEFRLRLEGTGNLVVRPGWYSLNTEGSTRTRFFWDRTKPFASYAMGMVLMTEFSADSEQVRDIRLAAEEDPNQDILPVHLENHPGYVVRQGHVVATSGGELEMKRKWRIWDWRSWLFGNIRYVYFTGTGTLYVSGLGCVSVNESSRDNRIKEQHVIGFETPIPFKMLRTETFANYWLNHKPLYDIHFPEQGRFVQQQSFGQRDDKIFRSLVEDVLGVVGKLLGLR